MRTRCAVALALVACCGYPEPRESLEAYHRRDIDRPYTLPSDVNSWYTLAEGGYDGPPEVPPPDSAPDQVMHPPPDGRWIAPSLGLLGCELSLGSNVTVEALPLLPAIRARLAHSPGQSIGLRAGPTRITWGDFLGLRVDAETTLYYRRRVSHDVAIVTETTVEYLFSEEAPDAVTAGVAAGPLVQVIDELSVRPYAQVIAHHAPRYRYGYVALGGELGYRIARRWRTELHLRTSPKRLGYDYNSTRGTARLTYYW